MSKSFGGLKVLDNLDFGIEAGKTTAVIGPSGCGKTVLLKHLIVLLRPESGEVYFDGSRVDNLKESKLVEVRRRCGFLFQAGALFDSQTVSQNVAFGILQHTRLEAKKVDQIVGQSLEMVGMVGFEGRYPSELSGGQQKRIALARAIAFGPEAILYDEPTTGLDPLRADVINELIVKLQRELKITSVVVTHDMHSVYKIADRIVMLGEGRIIADGGVEDIRNSSDRRVQQFIQGDSKAINNSK